MILEHPEEPGKKYALAFTLLVHLGLVLALFVGVQWKNKEPEAYEVELWSPQYKPATQVVPPPPPQPKPEMKPEPKRPEPKPEPKVEPPPRKPDIAIKEEKKKPEPKKELPKPEPKKPEPKPEPKKPEPKPEPKKTEAPKAEAKSQPKFDFSKELANETSQLKSTSRNSANAQHMANAAAAEAEQRASANRRGMESYIAKIRGKIRGNMVLPPGIQGNPEGQFEVSQLPSGEVLEVKTKRSTGLPALDRAIEAAIRRSSDLPKPDDPSLFQRELLIRYRPFEE